MIIEVNTFSPSVPHTKQKEVLKAIDGGERFIQLRAGRKWRKTSLLISVLFEKALETGLTCPYIAPNRTQAKSIAWDDHVQRILNELTKKEMPYKKNETELSVVFPNGGKVVLMGVENKEALRGISNWSYCAMDEYDDWEEDIFPTIIRPNLIVHKAGAIAAGTPKGFRNLYRLEKGGMFKSFHYTSYDNPDIELEELEALTKEYKEMGMSYYRQEILAEYEKPVGTVYEEWDMDKQYIQFYYNPSLPLHISWDFGINDPTAVLVFQPYGRELRLLDYIEANNTDLKFFTDWIDNLPYKSLTQKKTKIELETGDIAGRARSLVTGKSVIDEAMSLGHTILSAAIPDIPTQIRHAHKSIPTLFVNKANPNTERFIECILNYKYPTKSEMLVNQSNEIPMHDEFCITGNTKIRTLGGWRPVKDLVGKKFYVWGYSSREKRLVPTKAIKCWKTKDHTPVIEVGLDDGNSITCTPSHRFMLRDSSYKRAKDLKVGDSLMPFYEYQTGIRKHAIVNLNDGTEASEHRLVFSRLNGYLQEGMVIDHIDGNSHNNNPENLQQITIDEHCKKTKPHLGANSPVGKNRGMRMYEKKCLWCDKIYRGTWRSMCCSKICSSRRRSFIRGDEKRTMQPLKKCKWCGKEFRGYARELTCSNDCATQRTLKYNVDYQRNYRAVRKNNHKVMFIRNASRADVYDIEVPETHNFVANGVVLHNSHGMKAFEYYCWNVMSGTYGGILTNQEQKRENTLITVRNGKQVPLDLDPWATVPTVQSGSTRVIGE